MITTIYALSATCAVLAMLCVFLAAVTFTAIALLRAVDDAAYRKSLPAWFLRWMESSQ